MSEKLKFNFLKYFFGFIISYSLIFTSWTIMTTYANTTNSGKYIVVENCVDYETDEFSKGCVEYGEDSYIPFGKRLKQNILFTIVFTPIPTFILGMFLEPTIEAL